MSPCSTWVQKPRFQLYSSLKANWMLFSVARVADLHAPRVIKLFSRPIKGKHLHAQPNWNAAPSEQTYSISSRSVSFIMVLLTAGVSTVINPLTDVWACFHSRVGEDDRNSRLLLGLDDAHLSDWRHGTSRCVRQQMWLLSAASILALFTVLIKPLIRQISLYPLCRWCLACSVFELYTLTSWCSQLLDPVKHYFLFFLLSAVSSLWIATASCSPQSREALFCSINTNF